MFLSVPPCQALSWQWAFLSHSINQHWDAAALVVFPQPQERDESSLTTPFTEWLWGWAAIASVTTAPSPFEASMCPAKVQVDFIWADRRGEKLGKRRICSCVLSSCCHLLLLKLKEFVGCTLLAVQGEQEMNECLPGFTARLEPLCYTACLANLEGTRIGIVKRIMYAVFPPHVSLRSSLLC